MRDAVPPCGTTGGGGAPDPPEQTITTTFTPHAFKTTPE